MLASLLAIDASKDAFMQADGGGALHDLLQVSGGGDTCRLQVFTSGHLHMATSSAHAMQL